MNPKWMALLGTLLLSVWFAGHVEPAVAATPCSTEPAEGHAWLEGLVGEWEVETDLSVMGVAPDASVIQTTRALGKYWVVVECDMPFMSSTMSYLMTLGYDRETERYVGTWVDSSSDFLWSYEGTLDPERQVLTLLADGPGFGGEGLAKYKDEIELDGPDRKLNRNYILGADDVWHQMGEVVLVRKAE